MKKTQRQRWMGAGYRRAWSVLGFMAVIAGCSDATDGPNMVGQSAPANPPPAATGGIGDGVQMPPAATGDGGNAVSGADSAGAGTMVVDGAGQGAPAAPDPAMMNPSGGMAGMPMVGTPMLDMPMAGTPMLDMPTAGVPMAGVPMAGVPMAGVPMAGVPMMDVPMAGAEGSGADMDAAPEMRADQGEGDGSDVITIGDSWMNSGASGIQQSLVAASGQRYRVYGIPGTRMLAGSAFLPAIPDQYDDAKGENGDIKTVVMTGGGNDIIQVPGLQADCDAGGELCNTEVKKILESLSTLWAEMAADGVQDVVYVQYSDPEGNEIDFLLPDGDGIAQRCAAVPEPLRCHRLETDALVMQDIPDGIHPSGAGYMRIGMAVYELMVEQGMRR